MSWRIFVTSAVDPDLGRLDDEDRSRLNDDLFRWTDTGPPRSHRRTVAGVDMYEDEVTSGYRVTYVVGGDEADPYVAVLRIRRI